MLTVWHGHEATVGASAKQAESGSPCPAYVRDEAYAGFLGLVTRRSDQKRSGICGHGSSLIFVNLPSQISEGIYMLSGFVPTTDLFAANP